MFREKPRPPIPPQEDIMKSEYFDLGYSASVEQIMQVVREKYPDAQEDEVTVSYQHEDGLGANFKRFVPNDNYEKERQEYGIAYAQYAEEVIKWRDEYEDFNRNNANESE